MPVAIQTIRHTYPSSRLFFSKTAEIAVVGLQVSFLLITPQHLPHSSKASGKTSFVNVITSGQVNCSLTPLLCLIWLQWSENVVPTVAFNFRKVRKGNVTLKIWDVAGKFILDGSDVTIRWLPQANLNSAQCGSGIVTVSMPYCTSPV